MSNAGHLPTDAKERKNIPIATGVLDYFPLALAEIARVSKQGNDQHNPGEPLYWNRAKSTDEADALIRHFLERGKTDTDGMLHSAKCAWRALALLEKELEAHDTQKNRARHAMDLTYEEFFELTKIRECHYCGLSIDWDSTSGLNLDRKDSNLPYTKDNVVVSCRRCNYGKNNFFSYDEWKQIGALIRSWRDSKDQQNEQTQSTQSARGCSLDLLESLYNPIIAPPEANELEIYRINLANNFIFEGATVNIVELADDQTFVCVEKDNQRHSFVVRGKVQRQADCERGTVQPGPSDSRLKDSEVRDFGQGHLEGYGAFNNSEDQ